MYRKFQGLRVGGSFDFTAEHFKERKRLRGLFGLLLLWPVGNVEFDDRLRNGDFHE